MKSLFKNMNKISLLFIIALFLSACGGGSKEEIKIYTKTYEQNDTLNLLNPNRGFYDATYNLEQSYDYNLFLEAKKNGYNLVYGTIFLKDYKNQSSLPTTLLNSVKKNLKMAKEAEVGIILRIKYRDEIKSFDPSKDIILSHLNLLKPILQEYNSTISVVQAGLIGAWGEWHSFSGDFSSNNPNYLNNRKELLEKLIEIFPKKFIQIRTPMHKELFFSDVKEYGYVSSKGQITKDIAYSNDFRAKLAHHNDCFLASATDMGTYEEDNIAFWKNYVKNDSNYAPIGGETCAIPEDNESLISCENALKELKELHFAFLNDAYNLDVLNRWKQEGCYEKIKYNLGYKFVAKSLEYFFNNGNLNVSLKLENLGFAKAYKKAKVSFILKNKDFNYKFGLNSDIRYWDVNKEVILKKSIDLSNLQSGKYCLYLKIEDEISNIALANSNMWEDGLNKLSCNIEF